MLEPIPKLRFSEPRHNLPGRKGRATQEDLFTIAFGRCYLGQIALTRRSGANTNIALAREIPVNGYGIADLVAVTYASTAARYDSVESFFAGERAIVRAFECKFKNWRAALAQAVRYRYFAHQAIVVLPADACANVLDFLDTFRKTRVGLWTFDPSSRLIKVYHTPRAAKPKALKYAIRAAELVHFATKRVLPIQ